MKISGSLFTLPKDISLEYSISPEAIHYTMLKNSKDLVDQINKQLTESKNIVLVN